jgi:hypothetical protein
MHLAAALLAGLLLLGTTAVPASATMFGQVQSICLLPEVVALNMSTATNTPDDPLSGTANCIAVCQKWVTACKGAVNAAKACFNSAVAKLSALQNAVCEEHTDPGLRKFCKNGVSSNKRSAKDGLAASVEEGIAQCEGDGFGACLIHCN